MWQWYKFAKTVQGIRLERALEVRRENCVCVVHGGDGTFCFNR